MHDERYNTLIDKTKDIWKLVGTEGTFSGVYQFSFINEENLPENFDN